MKKLMLGLLILSLIGGMSWAADVPSAPDPTGAAYGARPLAMGGAFVGIADDTNAVFTNPAGLAKIKDWSLTSMSTQILQKVDYKLAGATYKWGIGTIGVGYVGTSAPCGYKYNEYGTQEGDSPIAYTSNMLLLSYGLDMANVMDMDADMGTVAVGGTLKLISKGFTEIDEATASGMDIDLGMTFEPKDQPFTLGAAVKNIADGGSISWQSGSKENLERSMKVGGAVKLLGDGGYFNTLPGNLLASLDMEQLGEGKPAILHAGTEYKPIKYLAIRVGLDQDPVSASETITSLTAGVGVNFMGFQFDYAYRANPDAAELSNHYFSLSFAPEEINAPVKEETKEQVKVEKNTKVTEKGKKTTSPNAYDLPEEYKNISF